MIDKEAIKLLKKYAKECKRNLERKVNIVKTKNGKFIKVNNDRKTAENEN